VKSYKVFVDISLLVQSQFTISKYYIKQIIAA